jgi:hypothetical protein
VIVGLGSQGFVLFSGTVNSVVWMTAIEPDDLAGHLEKLARLTIE